MCVSLCVSVPKRPADQDEYEAYMSGEKKLVTSFQVTPVVATNTECIKKNTNCPLLVNTSFNVRGEPIVCSIDDAFNCFMGTNLDILVIEDFVLFKNHQDKSLIKDYKNKFELD